MFKYKTHILIVWILTGVFATVTPNNAADLPDACQIELIAPQWAGRTLKLVCYFDGSRYTQDTVRLSADGRGMFRSQLPYPEGLYMIHLDSLHFFDFLMADDQQFTITVDTTDFTHNNRISGARQSEALQAYTAFMADRHRDLRVLYDEFKKVYPDSAHRARTDARLDSLNAVVKQYREALYRDFSGAWVAAFVRGLDAVNTGPYPMPQSLEQRFLERQYQKKHFFDNIDLQDLRFWYTGYFTQKIEQYLSTVVEPEPDTIAAAASWLVAQTLGDSICSRLMLGRLMNYALGNPIMGLENMWARLAEDYYFCEQPVYCPDSAFMQRLRSEYGHVRYNRIGMKAHDLALQDSAGQPVRLYDLAAPYTLVYFFEPDCGFCKKITPRIYHEIFAKYRDRGLDVACVCMLNNRDEWLDYIRSNGFTDWHNLWDPDRTSEFWRYYDTSTTPGIFLTDSTHTIIAKKLDVESLDRLLTTIFKQ